MQLKERKSCLIRLSLICLACFQQKWKLGIRPGIRVQVSDPSAEGRLNNWLRGKIEIPFPKRVVGSCCVLVCVALNFPLRKENDENVKQIVWRVLGAKSKQGFINIAVVIIHYGSKFSQGVALFVTKQKPSHTPHHINETAVNNFAFVSFESWRPLRECLSNNQRKYALGREQLAGLIGTAISIQISGGVIASWRALK